MRYAGIIKNDFAAAPGVCVSFYTQGCPHHCPGCHNPESWNPNVGTKFTKETEEEIMDVIRLPYIRGLTLSGGDPLYPQNRDELTTLVKRIKTELPDKDIWVWTGYEFDEIKDTELIKYCDVVVVGPFILEQRDISDANRWRGSRNQKIILIQESLKSKSTVYMPDVPNNE